MRSPTPQGSREQAAGRSAFGIIFLIVFLDLLGFSFVIPLFPEYRDRFHLNATEVALLNTSYSLAQFLFAPLLGRLSDRVGRRPVLAFSLLGSAVAFALFGAAQTAWLLFAARIVDGVTGGNIATAQAYVADVTTRENRAKGMGMVGAAIGLGFVLGPALGGFLGRYGLGVPAYAAAGLALANCLLVVTRLPESRHLRTADAVPPVRVTDVRRLAASLSHPVIGELLLVILLNMIAFAAMENTIGLLTKDRFGFDETMNGIAFAYMGLLIAFVQGGMVGRLSKQYGEARLVVWGILGTGLGLLLIPLVPSVALMALAGIPLAAGYGLFSPSANALISKSAGEDEQGGTLGLSQGLQSLGRVLGPVAGGLLYDGVGRGSPFLGGAALMLLCAALSLTVLRKLGRPQETAA